MTAKPKIKRSKIPPAKIPQGDTVTLTLGQLKVGYRVRRGTEFKEITEMDRTDTGTTLKIGAVSEFYLSKQATFLVEKASLTAQASPKEPPTEPHTLSHDREPANGDTVPAALVQSPLVSTS